MRFAARLAGVFLFTACLVGCDKAQVAQLESQMAAISVSVVGTDAELLNVWDLIEDVDLDGLPDDGIVYLFCETIFQSGSPPPPARTISVTPPWNHSLRISILRADSTEFEQLTDDVYLNTSANLSSYDPQVLFGNTILKPDPFVFGGSAFRFTNARQMSTVNRNVVVATSNPLSTLDLNQFGYKNGLCSEATDPGPSMFGGAPQPFTVVLGKGDTIKVEARKAVNPPQGLTDGAGNPLTLIEPVLVGELVIDGITINGLGGDASSEPVAGDGFSFFYSSR
jgi:hypothetical protein